MKKLLASLVLISVLILLLALGCAAAESGGDVTVDAAFIGNTTEDVQLRVTVSNGTDETVVLNWWGVYEKVFGDCRGSGEADLTLLPGQSGELTVHGSIPLNNLQDGHVTMSVTVFGYDESGNDVAASGEPVYCEFVWPEVEGGVYNIKFEFAGFYDFNPLKYPNKIRAGEDFSFEVPQPTEGDDFGPLTIEVYIDEKLYGSFALAGGTLTIPASDINGDICIRFVMQMPDTASKVFYTGSGAEDLTYTFETMRYTESYDLVIDKRPDCIYEITGTVGGEPFEFERIRDNGDRIDITTYRRTADGRDMVINIDRIPMYESDDDADPGDGYVSDALVVSASLVSFDRDAQTITVSFTAFNPTDKTYSLIDIGVASLLADSYSEYEFPRGEHMIPAQGSVSVSLTLPLDDFNAQENSVCLKIQMFGVNEAEDAIYGENPYVLLIFDENENAAGAMITVTGAVYDKDSVNVHVSGIITNTGNVPVSLHKIYYYKEENKYLSTIKFFSDYETFVQPGESYAFDGTVPVNDRERENGIAEFVVFAEVDYEDGSLSTNDAEVSIEIPLPALTAELSVFNEPWYHDYYESVQPLLMQALLTNSVPYDIELSRDTSIVVILNGRELYRVPRYFSDDYTVYAGASTGSLTGVRVDSLSLPEGLFDYSFRLEGSYTIKDEQSPDYGVWVPFASNTITLPVFKWHEMELSVTVEKAADEYTDGFWYDYSITNISDFLTTAVKLRNLNDASGDDGIDLGSVKMQPGESISGRAYCNTGVGTVDDSIMKAVFAVDGFVDYDYEAHSNEVTVLCDYEGNTRGLEVSMTGELIGTDQVKVNVLVVNHSGREAYVNTLDISDTEHNTRAVFRSADDEKNHHVLIHHMGYMQSAVIDITPREKERGYVELVAFADGAISRNEQSISGYSPVARILLRDSEIGMDFVETSSPANGEAYEVGETIAYSCTVTNLMNYDMKVAPLFSTGNADSDQNMEAAAIPLAPGETKRCSFRYTVRNADAQAGEVSACVTCRVNSIFHPDFRDGSEGCGEYTADRIVSKVVPLEVIDDGGELQMSAYVVNLSGAGWKEGDAVLVAVTFTNRSETRETSNVKYELLLDGAEVGEGRSGIIFPGMSSVSYCTDVLTAPDIERGYYEREILGTYYFEDDNENTSTVHGSVFKKALDAAPRLVTLTGSIEVDAGSAMNGNTPYDWCYELTNDTGEKIIAFDTILSHNGRQKISFGSGKYYEIEPGKMAEMGWAIYPELSPEEKAALRTDADTAYTYYTLQVIAYGESGETYVSNIITFTYRVSPIPYDHSIYVSVAQVNADGSFVLNVGNATAQFSGFNMKIDTIIMNSPDMEGAFETQPLFGDKVFTPDDYEEITIKPNIKQEEYEQGYFVREIEIWGDGVLEGNTADPYWTSGYATVSGTLTKKTPRILTPEDCDVSVTLTESSTPANKTAYKPGERITYTLAVTNNMEYPILDLRAYLYASGADLSDVGDDGVDASEHYTLAPGETITIPLGKTVSTYDVNAGHSVSMMALCGYRVEGLEEQQSIRSNDVESEVIPDAVYYSISCTGCTFSGGGYSGAKSGRVPAGTVITVAANYGPSYWVINGGDLFKKYTNDNGYTWYDYLITGSVTRTVNTDYTFVAHEYFVVN